MKFKQPLILAIFAVVAAQLLTGCGAARAVVCGEKAYSIQVHADPAFVANTSVKVDVVGVTNAELAEWMTRSADNYRSGADVYSMTFGQGRETKQALPIDHDLWQSWLDRRVTHLYMIALIPGMSSEGAGPGDPRIVEIPLDHCLWAGKPQNLVVSLRDSGLRVESALK